MIKRTGAGSTGPTRKDRAVERLPSTGFALGYWMAKLSISDQDLADRLHCRRESVWRWATGERQPTKGMIPKIAKALGLTPADLWRVSDFVDFNLAGAHIQDPEERQRIARFLRGYPASQA